MKVENDIVQERYQLAMKRILEIPQEFLRKEWDGTEALGDFFLTQANWILTIKELYELLSLGEYQNLSLDSLQDWNERLFGPIKTKAYENSYLNPTYAVDKLGEELGGFFAAFAVELRNLIRYSFEGQLELLTATIELFLEVYRQVCEKASAKEIKETYYYFQSDYAEQGYEYRFRNVYDVTCSFYRDIIEQSDLTDPRTLYFFGLPVGDNERRVAQFLSQMEKKEIEAMAYTFTNGFYKGFQINRIDLSKKETVNIQYYLGFERIIQVAIQQFEKMGLKTVVKCESSSINRQYSYDHQYDIALYLDKPYVDRRLAGTKKVLENYQQIARALAGPAVFSVFGEKPFAPENKKEAISLSEKQQELFLSMNNEIAVLTYQYRPAEETSFTIIAYPIPEIGEQFEEIFAQTVRVNTLDSELYKNIQQALIDALDKGEQVHILGALENKTDLIVSLQKLSDREHQTNFENCLDDVNIPVGEVFTSPRLAGTNGKLHITEGYIRGLHYKNLEIEFKDGMVTSYHCTNFEREEDNQKYIKENLLYNHDTLPMGEFAIGTNTTAFVMARNYQIQGKLPILIAEKTGPHFAVGDTCYSRSEDRPVYNPDGKEVVAKENECSKKRKEDALKAYFNCHTDITIPYNELKEISVIDSNGTRIPIILEGRFVLPGTEQLNEAFSDLD